MYLKYDRHRCIQKLLSDENKPKIKRSPNAQYNMLMIRLTDHLIHPSILTQLLVLAFV